MLIEVYTAITNEKDSSRDDIRVFSDYDRFKSPVMNAKIYKVLPHKFLDCDISIWLDGNIFLNVSKERLVEEFLGDADMAIFEHNHHKDIRWEAYMLGKMFRKRTPQVKQDVAEQMKYYEKIGIPSKVETAMGGMIIRRHKPIVKEFNEAWWAEICRWSQRDQLSFPIIKRQFEWLRVNFIKGNIKNHPYLRYETHNHFNT
jgi:hypothetical protein